jgi:CheY-like chemotaxis protein
MLLQRGYRVITASSGEQALQHAIAQRPDGILLDLLMAGMSGWETAAALKRHGKTCDIPVVILSVLAQAETEPPDGHVVDWVQKPLDGEQLFAALEHAETVTYGSREPLCDYAVPRVRIPPPPLMTSSSGGAGEAAVACPASPPGLRGVQLQICSVENRIGSPRLVAWG